MNRAKALAEAPEGALPDAQTTALAVRGHRPVEEAAAAAGAPLLPEAGGAIVPAGGAIVPAKKKRGKMSAYDGVKGPTTAYLYYQNEVREAVADEHPEMSTHQLMQEIGRRWRALSDEEKAPYKKKNEDDIARYHRDKRAQAEAAAAAAAEVLEGPSGSAAAAQELITDAAEWASAAAAAPRVLGAIARGEHLTGSAAADADADADVAAVEWGEEDAWEPPLAPGERTKYRGFPHLSAADNSTRSLCWKGGPLNHQPPKRNHAPPVQHFWAETRRPAASSSAAPQIQGFDPDVKTSFWSAVPSGVHGRMIDRFRGFRAEVDAAAAEHTTAEEADEAAENALNVWGYIAPPPAPRHAQGPAAPGGFPHLSSAAARLVARVGDRYGVAPPRRWWRREAPTRAATRSADACEPLRRRAQRALRLTRRGV